MKRLSLMILFFVTLLATTAVSAQTPASAPLPALTDVRYEECPVMGGKVQPDVMTVHEGKIYRFCCPGCIDTFKKDPAATIAKIKNPTEVPLKVTNADGICPVCGKAASAEFFRIDGDTVTYYFCKDCIGKEALKAAPSATPAPEAASGAAIAPAAADASADPGACGDCSSCGACPSAGK
ncbi:MAG TPA: hypothetical protein PLP29_03550 [Candidatus Ozemobacteraceae bacterium]|nr:hypothetical protein [Candidatus Ozemobacteraceae bacterium]